MEAIFENVCVRNREVTKEIYNYYFFRRNWTVVAYIILGLVLAANLGVLCLEGEPYSRGLLIFIPLVFIFQISRYFNAVKTTVMRYEETGQTLITTTVTDEFIQMASQNGASGKLEYGNVNKAIQTKNLIILETKAKMFYVFAKDGFTKGSKEDFVAFLQSKGIKIK